MPPVRLGLHHNTIHPYTQMKPKEQGLRDKAVDIIDNFLSEIDELSKPKEQPTKHLCISCKSVEVKEEHHACERCCVRGENTGHQFKLD